MTDDADPVPEIAFEDFLKVDIRLGVIVSAEPFPQARKPAYRLRIDFGAGIGERTSSAQITDRYGCADLIGRQVLAVVNLPPRRIGPFVSQVLTLGLADADGAVILATAERPAPRGARLH